MQLMTNFHDMCTNALVFIKRAKFRQSVFAHDLNGVAISKHIYFAHEISYVRRLYIRAFDVCT